MGWRENAATAAFYAIWDNHGDLSVHPDSLVTALGEMDPADRVALARELLAGTGRVVTRDVETLADVWDMPDGASDWRQGWNAARAAMLGDEE